MKSVSRKAFLSMLAALSCCLAIAQNVTMRYSDVKISTVLEEIERQTDYQFAYSATLVDVSQRTSVDVQNATVAATLSKALAGKGIGYRIVDKQISLYKVDQAPKGRVAGSILDAKGDPVPGAFVLIEGTTNGVVADANGRYFIEAPAGANLVISCLGFEDLVVPASHAGDIILKESSTFLDEAVTIGYGTVKRKNFTGAVSTVSVAGTPVSEIPRNNPLSALKGTVTGVDISADTGEAGRGPSSILIRGQKSLGGNSWPLIVVDGVISDAEIAPENIQSISILKDATSLAAYGSRAANGVIMITTKRGTSTKPTINFNSSISLSDIAVKTKVMDPYKYIRMRNAILNLPEDADPLTAWPMKDFEAENYRNGTPTNVEDYATRTGVLQNYNASVSGIKDKVNYYFSAGYKDQKGLMRGDDWKNINLNMKVETDITDWLQVGGRMIYSNSDWSGPGTGDYTNVILGSPWGRYSRPNGMPEKYPTGSQITNPLWTAMGGTIDDEDKENSTSMDGHVLVRIPWVEGLSFRMNGNYRIRNAFRNYFVHEGNFVPNVDFGGGVDPEDRYMPENQTGYLNEAYGYRSNTRATSWVWDNILNYNRTFGDHYFDATLVYTRDCTESSYTKITGKGFTGLGNTLLGAWGLTQADLVSFNDRNKDINYIRHSDIGYLARLNYAFRDKYHLSASVRRDGSSVFGAAHKWGIFPAFGAAWTVSNEPFMAGVKDYIDFLKLKVSWGRNGNQGLEPYQTMSRMSSAIDWYNFGPYGIREPSWAINPQSSDVGNGNLAWETTESLNYGAEIGLLNERIHIDFDGYFSQTYGQIFERAIPVIVNGVENMYDTMGQIDNWGLELNLTTENIRTRDFSWTSRIGFYMNRNKLVELYGDGHDDLSRYRWHDVKIMDEPLSTIYGYNPIGIIQAAYDANGKPILDDMGRPTVADEYLDYVAANGGQPGDVVFENADGSEDNKITADDRKILGNMKPGFSWSFANDLTWKNFEFYVLFTGIGGGNGYAQFRNRWAYLCNDVDTGGGNVLDHDWWSLDHPSTTYPRAAYSNADYIPIQSWAFVRLQDLSLSYKLNPALLSKLNISALKLYFSCHNLLTLTNWEGGDPEKQQTRSEPFDTGLFGHPTERSYSFGINLTF